MNRPHILHLVDDTTAGGVMRVLDYICTNPELAQTAHHSLQVVKRGAMSVRRYQADVIVSHLSISWRTLPALISLRATHAGTPLMHVEHSYTQAFTALNVGNRKRFTTLLRIAYSMFDHLVAVSEAQANWILRRGLVDQSALSVIQPMVDLTGFQALPSPSRDIRRIGAIGRLDRQKGFDLLVNAFRALPDENLELVFFGDGPERELLQNMARGDHRIHFAGHVSDPIRAMNTVQAVAMPSRWEAFGLVAREALAAGRPVLVSGKDGLADQVNDGAILVPDFTVCGWTAALGKLVRSEFKPQPRQNTNESEAVFARKWNSLIETAISSQSPKSEASLVS